MGTMMTAITKAVQAGSNQPARRHSYQNCAAAGDAKSLRRLGKASMARPQNSLSQCSRRPPPHRCLATAVQAIKKAVNANPMSIVINHFSDNHGEGMALPKKGKHATPTLVTPPR